MEKEVERLVNIWKNEFALSYKDKPRLYNTSDALNSHH